MVITTEHRAPSSTWRAASKWMRTQMERHEGDGIRIVFRVGRRTAMVTRCVNWRRCPRCGPTGRLIACAVNYVATGFDTGVRA